MAGYISTYLSQKFQDLALGDVSWTPSSTLYCRLWLTLPTADNIGGIEVAVGGYAPVAKTNNLTNFPLATSQKSNGTAIDFGTPSADWGSLAGATIEDAASSGNMYFAAFFASPRFVSAGVPFSIAIGGLVWQFGACA